jgi:lipoate-protein ligase A
MSLDAAYAGFGQLLIAALGRLGLEVDLGPVPNAHCDGRFNLRWRQYKLAGTAGFRRQRLGRVAWLIHASLAVSGPIEQDLALIERFESALGAEPRYRADAHATLEHALTAVR